MFDLYSLLRSTRKLLAPIQREELTLLALDTETSGLDPVSSGVMEVGWQVVERGVLTVADSMIVRPSRRSYIVDDHDGCRANVSRSSLTAPTVGVALERIWKTGNALAERTGTRPRLVFHNGPYDLMFIAVDQAEAGANLRWLLTEAGGPFARRPLDTQALIQPMVLRGQMESSSLKALCEMLGVRPGNHRAQEDARATAECAIELLTGGWV